MDNNFNNDFSGGNGYQPQGDANFGGYQQPQGDMNYGGYQQPQGDMNYGGYQQPQGDMNYGGYQQPQGDMNYGGYQQPQGDMNYGGYQQPQGDMNYNGYQQGSMDFNGYQTPNYQPQPMNLGNGEKQGKKALVALILGISAIVVTCCCTYLGIGLGIAAIVLAQLDKKDNGGVMQGKALAGMICGIVAIAFAVVSIILVLAGVVDTSWIEDLFSF